MQEEHVIPGRVAHLTAPPEEQLSLGRSACLYRNLCMRGCPFGGYFSSQAATSTANSAGCVNAVWSMGEASPAAG